MPPMVGADCRSGEYIEDSCRCRKPIPHGPADGSSEQPAPIQMLSGRISIRRSALIQERSSKAGNTSFGDPAQVGSAIERKERRVFRWMPAPFEAHGSRRYRWVDVWMSSGFRWAASSRKPRW